MFLLKVAKSQKVDIFRKTWYAKAKCFAQKKMTKKIFRFKKFSIKQALFIDEISSSRSKAQQFLHVSKNFYCSTIEVAK